MSRPFLRNKLIFLLFIVICIALFSLSITNVHAEQASEEITILFTHDLHDNFYPFEIEENDETTLVGGYARLATAIEEEREKDPEAILVGAGDYSMGTLFQTIFSSHAPTLKFMGLVGYDAVTFGNHEFDFRAGGLAQHLKAANQSSGRVPPIVATNIISPNGKMIDDSAQELHKEMDEYGVMDYIVIDQRHAKIGVIGLLGENAVSNAPMAGVEFEDIIASSEKTVKTLKENVDLIIAISHSGTAEDATHSEDEILAEKVPEIDVIISGHSHTLLEEPIIINDTVIGSTGEYGKNLGVITLKEDTNDRWDLIDYQLIRIDQELAPNEDVRDMIDDFKTTV